MLFKKEKQGSYDPTEKKPMIRASICNGEEFDGAVSNCSVGVYKKL